MPGYRTHITASAICGTAVSGISYIFGNVDLTTSIYGGILCAIGGIVPDIDSETSTSFRRCMLIVAGFPSLLLVSRMRDYILDPQTVAIIGGGNFLFVWFVLGALIRKATVHRGMCHSIPMAALTGEIAYLLSSGGVNERLYCGMAAAIGVLLHLLLDEFCSVQVKKGTVRVKKSIGSALKIVNFENKKATFCMFAILGFFTFLIVRESAWSQSFVQSGTIEYTRQNAKDYLEFIQHSNPEIYDLSVVKWALDNDIQIKPRTSNNSKWKDLKKLFSNDDYSSSEHNSSNEGSAQRKNLKGISDWGEPILRVISSGDGVEPENFDGSTNSDASDSLDQIFNRSQR